MRCRTCTSSLYTSTYGQLIPEFGSSRLVCTLGLSLFVAGLGIGPMVLSPISEVSRSAQMGGERGGGEALHTSQRDGMHACCPAPLACRSIQLTPLRE